MNDDYKFTEFDIPGANIQLCENFLHSPPSVMDVIENVEFDPAEKTKVHVYGKWFNIPRRQTSYGDEGTFYRFSGHKSIPKPWTPFMENIKFQIEAVLETSFNFVLVNMYNDGNHHIGWHSDDEKDLKDNHIIASYSVGAPRDFLLKNKKTKRIYTINLPHNSLLIMGGDTQTNYLHSVPKRGGCKEPRINFTWRQMR